jgi:hypothetical protein
MKLILQMDLSLWSRRQRGYDAAAVAEDRATLGSDLSAATVPNGTGGVSGYGPECRLFLFCRRLMR